ncbi:MAG TPA: hypothetical protein VJZ00_18815 [Thermoanaerobaculia bacterium]|nr:hypothetical protein [Thermoanaerobaculia bacterium]
MHWFGPAFLAVVAVLVFLQRRPLARAQANVLGGSLLPGCVIAQAIALLLLAIAMLAFTS